MGKKTRQSGLDKSLLRENSRLKKEVQKLNWAMNGLSDLNNPSDVEKSPKEYRAVPKCPKCEHPVSEMALGRFNYILCGECGFRTRKS